jgi:hypothetical protein
VMNASPNRSPWWHLTFIPDIFMVDTPLFIVRSALKLGLVLRENLLWGFAATNGDSAPKSHSW